MHLGRTLQETWTVNELVTQTAKAKCMNELNIKSKNEYIHRNIRINRCNDNYFSNLTTDFHLVNPVDEINRGIKELLSGAPPSLINRQKHEQQKRQ